jgi:hypothetical protein
MSSETLPPQTKEPVDQIVQVKAKQKKALEIVIIRAGSNNPEMVTNRDIHSEKHESRTEISPKSSEIIFKHEKNNHLSELVPSFSYISHWKTSIILTLFFLLFQLLMLFILILSKNSVI